MILDNRFMIKKKIVERKYFSIKSKLLYLILIKKKIFVFVLIIIFFI